MTELSKNKEIVYFPGLNGLRFIAAFLVIISHTEYYKGPLGYKDQVSNSFIFSLGDLSVTFFFVLSGFLITFLLLKEKDQFNSISIRSFYIKRVLRIWPLYFCVVLLGLFLYPYIPILNHSDYVGFFDDFGIKVILFMLFFPNLVLLKYGVTPFIAPTWSVGVEEQFYLIWPWLVKYSKRYLLILTCVVFVVFFMTHLAFFAHYFNPSIKIQNMLNFVSSFFMSFRIGAMSIGGIGAYLIFAKKNTILNFIYRLDIQIALNCILFILLYKAPQIPYIKTEVYSILFCLVILNVSSNSKTLYKLENPMLNFLGKISFGLYLWHAPVVFLVIYFMEPFLFGQLNFYVSNFILHLSGLLLSIFVSYLSYYLMEKRFLNFKKHFQRVPSTN